MNSLEFAVKMEKEGEKYYREHAETYKKNPLSVVCNKLADEEMKHATLIESWKPGNLPELEDRDVFTEIMNVFEGAENVKILGKMIPSQVDFYRAALEFEQKSIELYRECLAKTEDQEEMRLFEYLIHQEKHHFAVLDEIDRMLTKADDWVENAEFGLREEY